VLKGNGRNLRRYEVNASHRWLNRAEKASAPIIALY
jgi:hypothetical protein